MSISDGRAALTLDVPPGRTHDPLLPSIVFAAVFGSLAAQKVRTWDQALAMSGIVFAGASQIVSFEIWREMWSLPALLEVIMISRAIEVWGRR
jgi:predicted branched-subunit amino acid permease